MPQNFIVYDRTQVLLLPPDLTDWVPKDQLVWSILGAVEQMDLSGFYGMSQAEQPRPGIPRSLDTPHGSSGSAEQAPPPDGLNLTVPH